MARIGIIGNGGFTDFLLRSWRGLPDVEVTAISARNEERLRETARRHGIPHAYAGDRGWRDMLADAPIDLVAVVTPPSLHAEMAIAAAEAGKGVLCEKPLAITVKSGERLRDAVVKRKVPFVINYVMRYNPLFVALKAVVDGGVLGGLRRVDFTNLASDEGLAPDHWFWDLTQSGGILIEHGVHFFDVYAWLIGADPESVQGIRTVRAGTKQEDRVVATVHYANGALGTYYHAFDRPSRLEFQQALLSFDQGTIRVNGWIAISAQVDAAVSNAQAERLTFLLPPAATPHEGVFTGTAIQAHGGGHTYRFDRRLRYESKFAPDQTTMYAQNVRDSIMDLVAAWKDPSHRVAAGIEDALSSLRTACAVG
ncbi:MAG TPA: Gfo/Idh/MocA family oxidoreductase [Armatimonadota bacterium]